MELDDPLWRTYFRKATLQTADLAEEKMSNSVHDRIQSEVAGSDVLLFMKGTPVFPQCGFSAAVVQILSNTGVKFKAIDVLKDPEIRSGIKEFSNWPTIPQLYVKGEFVGGADILREMYEADELAAFLSEKGIALESV
jgi:monothiol glutaredoxin